MDFVFGLPRSPRNHNAIWVVVDRLTKSSQFILIQMNYSLDKLAKLYINPIVRLLGVLVSIVSNRDLRFTSRFWDSLQKSPNIWTVYEDYLDFRGLVENL